MLPPVETTNSLINMAFYKLAAILQCTPQALDLARAINCDYQMSLALRSFHERIAFY